jgi:hypothetical protein
LTLDLLLVELKRLDLVLDVFTLLFVPDNNGLASLFEHDGFELHLAVDVHKVTTLRLEVLQLRVVFFDHSLL